MQKKQQFRSGDSMRRVEDEVLITCKGEFTDDLKFPDMVYLHLVRSPHARAAVKKIDARVARSMPGVLDIYTSEDLVKDGVNPYPVPGPPGDFVPREIVEKGYLGADGKPYDTPQWYALARDEVRYVGEPVAAVLAETCDQAVEASEKIEVDYGPLPAVGTIKDASDPKAPQIWPGAPRNLLIRMEHGDREKTEALFESAAHVTRLELSNSRLVGNAMEPRASVCRRDPDKDRLILYTGHQAPLGLQGSLAEDIFGWGKERLRVVGGVPWRGVRNSGGNLSGGNTNGLCCQQAGTSSQMARRPDSGISWYGSRQGSDEHRRTGL